MDIPNFILIDYAFDTSNLSSIVLVGVLLSLHSAINLVLKIE